MNIIKKNSEQILLGSLLGDGSISYQKKNNCYRYSEAHCSKQKDYLIWKNKILNFNFRYDKKSNQYRIHKGNKDMKEFYFLFYKYGKKVINREILDMLSPLGIAVWICDDGSYMYGNGNIRISTHSFSLEEHNLMKIYFKEKWELECTFFKIKRKEGQSINGKLIKTVIPIQYYIHFDTESTKRLIEIIQPYIIYTMRYKIGLDKRRAEHAKKRRKDYSKVYNPHYHLKNRVKELKRSKDYYQKVREGHEFKLKNRKKTKVWREKNPEKVKEWKETNTEKIKEYQRIYRDKQKELNKEGNNGYTNKR